MIQDHLDHSKLYTAIHPLFAEAFAFLQKFDPATPEGKIQIRGDDLTASVQRYETKPAAEKKFEAHRDFIDIQFLATGSEAMEYGPPCAYAVKAAYNPEKDVELYHDAVSSRALLRPGEFCIFYPHDVHKPGCSAGNESVAVCKVVLKIRVQSGGA